MYTNVIIGIDGRQGGQDAAALAAILSGPGARHHLVFVAGCPPPRTRGAQADLHLELVDPDCLSERMSTERRRVGGDAPTVRVIADSAAAGLQEAAAERDADLIVVCASRRDGLQRLEGHDDVAALLHDTFETIAVAPSGYSREPGGLERIGVAFDRSPESVVALAHGGLLADERGCQLVVRNVTGSPHEGLVALSSEVDVLVCGSRRQGPLRRLALGSTSQYLARHVGVPLIITPPVDTPATSRWKARHPTFEELVS
jgi:nucleotide-binding universal stress UspA family protein